MQGRGDALPAGVPLEEAESVEFSGREGGGKCFFFFFFLLKTNFVVFIVFS